MTDDEYNRLFRKDDDPGWALWIAIGFVAFASLLVFLLPANAKTEDIEPHHMMPYVDEDCGASFACTDQIWELMYKGKTIPLPDMSQEECEAFRAGLENQTEAFVSIYCRPRIVERERS